MPATLNLPNTLTWIRISLIPLIVLVFYLPYAWSGPVAAIIFSLAGITDWLDGYFARRLNQASAFGAFLDPVADKLLVVMAMVLLAANHTSIWFVLPTAVIIAREVFVSALREWMANSNKRNLVKVGYIGKVKTTVQMVGITILLATNAASAQSIVWLGYFLIYISAVFSLWSMVSYLRAALPTLRGE